jgi:PRTRC genetic system protein B
MKDMAKQSTDSENNKLLPPLMYPLNGADAAILFFKGQLVFKWKDGSIEKSKCISMAAAQQSFSNMQVDSGWLTPEIVRWGSGLKGEWFIAWLPPAHHQIKLLTTNSKELKRHISITVPLPGLVFIGVENNYHVLAVKEEVFSPAANIYVSPLPNISSDAKICFGNNSLPPFSTKNSKKVIELFFDAPFNGDYCSQKSRKYPEDIRLMLVELASRKARRYPKKDLVPYNCSLETAVNKFTRPQTDYNYYV